MTGDWIIIDINWTPRIAQIIDDLGELAEANIQALRDEGTFIAGIQIRNRDGGYNIAGIVESALTELVGAVQTLPPDEWNQYCEQYLELRTQDTRGRCYLSTSAQEQIERLGRMLAERGIDRSEVYWRGGLNRKLLITVALLYTHQRHIGN